MPRTSIRLLALVGALALACTGPAQPSPTQPRPTESPTGAPTQPTIAPTSPATEAPQPTAGQSGSPAASATPTVGATQPPTPPSSPPSATGQWPPPAIAFERVADGFDNLTFLTHAGDGSGLIYVVEQRGVIHVGDSGGAMQPEPFLDISDRISAGGERGLLGLAFHPAYADDGRFFVNYTDRNGNTVVAEFQRAGPVGSPGDPASERQLLHIEQPFANHNGGMIAFGSDGMLYIATGDGGSGGDPHNNGQDLSTLLGALLRIDVDGGEPYAIPADNPFLDAADARPEIWDYGLRNPWRFSFDHQTGDLFIGDVGQNVWEEIDAEPAGSGGFNYGWNIMEGPDCFRVADCDMSGLMMPVAWYETNRGCAVTGGYVYRGQAIPALGGSYLYADYCSGDVWALEASAAVSATDVPVDVVEMGNAGINVTSFGEDEAGELYLVGAGGEVLRVVAGE